MYPHPESALAEVKRDRHRRGSGGSWGKALRLGIPLLLAALLAGIAIFLLVREAQRTREIEASLKIPPQYSRTPIPPEGYPRGSPTDPSPAPLKRYGGEYPRWNLKELPQGWDAALAQTIHSYFEAMTVDLTDDVKLSELQRIREEFAEFLSKLGPEALPTLAAILNAEGDFVNRRFLLKTIGSLGPSSEAATFVLRDFYMARHSDIRNDSEMWHVIDAMTQLKNQSSFGVLADFIDDPDPNVDRHRSHFVEALGEHPRRAEAVSTFTKHMQLETEASKSVRNKAAQALGKVRSPDTLPDLYRAAENEGYFVIKQTILGSIGKVGNPDSIPFLEEQYRRAMAPVETKDEIRKQDSFAIRLSAARAISRIGTPYARQTLEGLLESEPDAKARKYIEKWIGEIK